MNAVGKPERATQAELFVPAPGEKLTSQPVSTRVNKAGGTDGATLIEAMN